MILKQANKKYLIGFIWRVLENQFIILTVFKTEGRKPSLNLPTQTITQGNLITGVIKLFLREKVKLANVKGVTEYQDFITLTEMTLATNGF